ncbi:MAG TPA: aldehyde dehydrogenase family protein [Longimicrobium sp.]|nr:aldehyde dehydrogenase family protein [Longimicrobium sp.]
MSFTSAQLTTLEALCRRMVPLPEEPDPSAAVLARAVEARLAADPEASRQLAALLGILDHPATACLTGGVPLRFTRMTPARQDRWLRGWETSRVPARRTIFQAVKRVILSTWYGRPEVQAAIGHRGPLHPRKPSPHHARPLRAGGGAGGGGPRGPTSHRQFSKRTEIHRPIAPFREPVMSTASAEARPSSDTPPSASASSAEEAVRAAVGRARAAQAGWGALPVRERARRMRAFRGALIRRMDEVVETIHAETGKPRIEALGHEVFIVAGLVRAYEKRAPKVLRPRRVGSGLLVNKSGTKRYEPFGVVGVISPWNFPFSMPGIPMVGALFAGNGGVIKPSEVTPRSGSSSGRSATSSSPSSTTRRRGGRGWCTAGGRSARRGPSTRRR